MKRFFSLALILILLAGLALPMASFAAELRPSPTPRTYNVLVGWEDPHKGVGIMAYFPGTVTIHVGDTVHWIQNSNEFHTVTFLAGSPPPPLILPSVFVPGADPNISPLVLNPAVADRAAPPDGQYDGTTPASSGIMGFESWEYREFSLTFTQIGTYDYLCLIHGVQMPGQVNVVGPDVLVPTPNQAMAQGQMQIARQLAQVPAVLRAAQMQVQPPVMNPDGTRTHTIYLGYSQGQIDLMRFFPDKEVVSPGDTVAWEFSPTNDAPHTITFLNGAPEPDLVIVAPPFLYFNPAVLGPYQPGPELTRSGIYNSGVISPPVTGPIYSLTIGDMTPGLEPFLCMLHDESGMKGNLMVVSRSMGIGLQ